MYVFKSTKETKTSVMGRILFPLQIDTDTGLLGGFGVAITEPTGTCEVWDDMGIL